MPVFLADDFNLTASQRVSFSPVNYRDRHVRHYCGKFFIHLPSEHPGTPFEQDATFIVEPGKIAGDYHYSFRSVNYPNLYLRHRDARLVLEGPDVNPGVFAADATFHLYAGFVTIPGERTVCFQSVNYPKRLIRHRSAELWIDEFDGSDLFKLDATYAVTVPLAP